ncbi:MMPL family transporter [Streptomyces xanthochromogenes]|uniref:MMPL family transporter n=1 Tax=Streptomyces xanthochromogenes TaxID=67384 RepID=UPI00343B1EAA
MKNDSSAEPGTGLLHRLGSWCARHAWRVVVGWLVLLVVIGVAHGRWGGSFADSFSLPGTSTQTGADLLKAHGGTSGTTAPIVIKSDQGSVADHQASVEAAVNNLKRLPDVVSVNDPLTTPGAVSPNGDIAQIGVTFTSNPAGFDHSYVGKVDSAVQPLRADHVEVEYGDPLGQLAAPKAADLTSEMIGLGVALLVLMIGFGSVAAAVLPLVTAVLGLAVGLAGLGLLAAQFSFGEAAPTLAAMMGLGVGIDYALFLSTRYRALLGTDEIGGAGHGLDPAEAVGRTVATSGRSVLVAAATVAMALAGLYVSGMSFIGTLGAAAGLTVIVAAAASVTLTPALLGPSWSGRSSERSASG